MLGARLMNPQGEVLRFGGTVFKNVAGFDAFRLMAGSLGCFGPILEVSLRVTPRPRVERALVFEMVGEAARTWVTGLMGRPLPCPAPSTTGPAYTCGSPVARPGWRRPRPSSAARMKRWRPGTPSGT
uniref:FAD-binding PCMH-type domain-containing protein n=1 Tax=Phenylobacterium glaciei TaxID=2803784 RepID=A0A974S7I9_9CAUL|nr:hypothetical protein JKL49_19230 [Phenylobacterium glaciei]